MESVPFPDRSLQRWSSSLSETVPVFWFDLKSYYPTLLKIKKNKKAQNPLVTHRFLSVVQEESKVGRKGLDIRQQRHYPNFQVSDLARLSGGSTPKTKETAVSSALAMACAASSGSPGQLRVRLVFG